MLNQDEVLRYSRHFPIIGEDGQERLRQARVLCIGAGGLGCPALLYLAAAGVGHLGIVDDDRVELSNLQRQILFTEKEVGQLKVACATGRLSALNSQVDIASYPERLNDDDDAIIKDYDIVLDATDNYQSRYLINRLCRQFAKPLVSASIFQFEAQISVFNYQGGPCYECLFPKPPEQTPNCIEGGVLGVLPGIAGSLQANEVIKVILQKGDVLSGRLLCIDALSMTFSEFSFNKQKNCSQTHCANTGEKSMSTKDNIIPIITPHELKQRLEHQDDFVLIDVRELAEKEVFDIGGKLIPLNTLPEQMEQLPKDKDIIVYCKSGGRSAKATRFLLAQGYPNVFNLHGGILAWIAAGFSCPNASSCGLTAGFRSSSSAKAEDPGI